MSGAADARVFGTMICKEHVLPLAFVGGRHEVTLTEERAPTSQVRLCGVPEDSVVIKIGNFPDTRKFFQSGHALNHRADYMIVCPSSKVVVYVEIKEGRDSRAEVVSQLRGAECTGVFIRELGRVHLKQKDFFEGYRNVFVGFSHATVNKRVTGRPTQKGSGASPEDLKQVNFSSRCQFARLIA